MSNTVMQHTEPHPVHLNWMWLLGILLIASTILVSFIIYQNKRNPMKEMAMATVNSMQNLSDDLRKAGPSPAQQAIRSSMTDERRRDDAISRFMGDSSTPSTNSITIHLENQIPGNKVWTDFCILEPFDRLNIKAEGSVCSGSSDPCSGPNGILGLAKTSLTFPDQFPLGDANLYALIGRIVDQNGTVIKEPFQIGEEGILEAKEKGTLQVMANFRLPYIKHASGSFLVKGDLIKGSAR